MVRQALPGARSAATHLTTALLPTIRPVGEKPMEMYPPLSGADSTKLHTLLHGG
jgi:hypothetical protein